MAFVTFFRISIPKHQTDSIWRVPSKAEAPLVYLNEENLTSTFHPL